MGLTEILEAMNLWHWFALGVGLGMIDVLFGASFFLVWLGLSAILVGIVMAVLPNLAWEYQWLIFSIASATSIVFWHTYLKRNPTETDKPRLNRRSEQYIGRVFTLEEPIVNGRGKIHVDDSNWRIEGEDMPAGTKVRVTDVNGVILKVEKVV